MADSAGPKRPRIDLTEDYDPQYGFLTDAWVDVTTNRQCFMARPAVKFSLDLGANPITFSAGNMQLEAVAVIDSPPNSTGPVSVPSSAFAIAVYSGTSTGLGTPRTFYAQIVLYSTSLGPAPGTLVGNTVLDGFSGHAITPPMPFGTRIRKAPNFFWIPKTVTISNGGTGYTNGNTVSANTTGAVDSTHFPFTATITGVSGGVVTNATVFQPGVYETPPTNPISFTGGSGTGITMTVTWQPAIGFMFVTSQNAVNGTLVIVDPSANTILQSSTIGPSYGGNPYTGQTIYQVCAALEVIDGYTCFLTQDGNLWNSNPNDPITYNGLSFQQAFSDSSVDPITLATHGGYLVAIGDIEIRYFITTGAINGSAFAPIKNTRIAVGAMSAATVAQHNEYLMFVGNPDATGTPVYIIGPSQYVPERITTPFIEAQLSSVTIISASFVETKGHILFKVATTTGQSFIFDLMSKKWYLWNFPAIGGGMDFYDTITSQNSDDTFVLGYDLPTKHLFLSQFQSAGNDILYGGATSAYTPSVTTPPQDFELASIEKQWEAVYLVGDRTPVSSVCTLTYSDDNGQTFSSPGRSMDLSLRVTSAKDLGQSYRRTWRLTTPADWSVRLDYIEMKVALCTD